jgi:hypothetical protein
VGEIMSGGNYDLSSFQYAFSTIAQTLATGFALLTAVVMYRLQSISATFPVRARSLEGNLDFNTPQKQALRTRLNYAYEKGDWDTWLSVAKGLSFPPGLDEKVLRSEAARLEGLDEDISRIVAIKKETRQAWQWTSGTIAGALVMIMLMNKAVIVCTPAYALAWLAVIADTAAAIVCLWKYRPLLLEVISPPRSAKSGSQSNEASG